VLPLAGSALYALLGTPAALLPQPTVAAAEGRSHQLDTPDMEQMVARLAARLEKNPDDKAGWAMLARSYHAMRRAPQALAAFERLGDDVQRDPTLLAEYADVLATAAGGNIEGKPLQLVQAALKLNPDHGMALSLAATAAYRRNDLPEAARHWQRLLKQVPPDSEDAKWLMKTLSEIGAPAEAPAAAAPKAGGTGRAAAR